MTAKMYKKPVFTVQMYIKPVITVQMYTKPGVTEQVYITSIDHINVHKTSFIMLQWYGATFHSCYSDMVPLSRVAAVLY